MLDQAQGMIVKLKLSVHKPVPVTLPSRATIIQRLGRSVALR